jgi:hypothetical protein
MSNPTSGKYSTNRTASSSTPPQWRPYHPGGTFVRAEGVSLLGVRVTAHAILNTAEHERRRSASLGAITDPALLDRLMDLPVAVPVADPVIWAEMEDQSSAVINRDSDGETVARLLESPLTTHDVVVAATAGRELNAVQDASLFASFTRRWVATTRRQVPACVMLEAKICGVGVLDRCGRVLLTAQAPAALVIDGWTWLLQEKTYRRWLSEPSRDRASANPAPAIAEARETQTARCRPRSA